MKWAILAALMTSGAVADEAICLIQVDGTTYLDGPCQVERSPLGVDIGIGETTSSRYFATLQSNEDGKSVVGYWNGEYADSHAHDDLGILTTTGACWVGDRAKVCAYDLTPMGIGTGN